MLFFVALLLRSGLALGLAWLLCRFPRQATPASRHRILLSAFALLLAWPLYSLLFPELLIPFGAISATSALVTVQQTIRTPSGLQPALSGLSGPFLLWAAGVFGSLAPVLLAYRRLSALTGQAKPLCHLQWAQLLHDLTAELRMPREPALLVFPGAITPQTFGWRRPTILLPSDCLDWSPIRRRAVLLHELAHIQRRDVLSLLLLNLVTALWWFQPLCWVLRWQARLESEEACDAAVLQCGVRASDYASELLHLAGSLPSLPQLASAAISMASTAGSLERRLKSILQPPDLNRLNRASLSVITLALFTITASAVTVMPHGQPKTTGVFSMNRTIFSGLLASAGLSAATIGGSILDPSGAAVSNAKASLYNPDTASRQETAATPNGRFSFSQVPAGQYILRVDKPGFASLLREFSVQQNSQVDRGLVLGPGSDSKVTEQKPQPEGPDVKQIRIPGERQQSNLIFKVQPVYPGAAKTAGVQGKVLLDAVISADGIPREIRVVSSPSDDLSESALEAVRQWRYSTTLLNGQPVEVLSEIVVNYTLAP